MSRVVTVLMVKVAETLVPAIVPVVFEVIRRPADRVIPSPLVRVSRLAAAVILQDVLAVAVRVVRLAPAMVSKRNQTEATLVVARAKGREVTLVARRVVLVRALVQTTRRVPRARGGLPVLSIVAKVVLPARQDPVVPVVTRRPRRPRRKAVVPPSGPPVEIHSRAVD